MRKADSIYRALSGLPEFLEDNKISLKELRGDDSLLYAQAMEGVQQIADREVYVRPRRHCNPGGTVAPKDPRRLLEEAVWDNRNLNVSNMPEYTEGFAEGTSPVTLDKLKRGEFSVQATLDLHGLCVGDARTAFEQFLRRSILVGLHCVKVVHGRGLKSRDLPVLKENLKAWIIRAMNRKWIRAFSNAPMGDGGPGAMYILLKKAPVKRRIHILG